MILLKYPRLSPFHGCQHSNHRRSNPCSISETQEQDYVYWKKVRDEFEKLNIKAVPANLALVSTNIPMIYGHLTQDAQNSASPNDAFMASPDKIIASLEHTKKYAVNFLAMHELKHIAYHMAQQMKFAKLIPDGKRVDFLK